MDSRVSIVNANTFSYTDVGRIKESVNKAIEMIGLKFLKPGMNVLIKPNLVMDRISIMMVASVFIHTSGDCRSCTRSIW